MPTKSYDVILGTESTVFDNYNSSAIDSFLIADNIGSEVRLTHLEHDDPNFAVKKVYSVQSSIRKTKIEANTIDLFMTDLYDADGGPLFFKTPRKLAHINKVLVNGNEAPLIDSNFIYTNEINATIEYYQDEELVLFDQPNYYPIFIWDQLVYLNDIIALDNKKISFRERKGRISISASKPNVYVEVDNSESIFKLSKIDDFTFLMYPFYYRTSRMVDGINHVFIYDYTKSIPNLKTISHELCFVEGNSYIKLFNSKILKESVEIEVYDRETRQVIEIVNSGNATLKNQNIDSQKGIINISGILEDGDYSVEKNYFKASYSFMELKDLTVELERFSNNLFNKDIYFSIKPTKILFDKSQYDFPVRVTYSIFDDDRLEFTTDTEFTLSEPIWYNHYGYGEEGYSEHGYSGIADPELEPHYDYQKYINDDKGYSEDGYGDGPFGGDYIKSIDSMRRLVELRQDSIIGSIIVAKYSTKPIISDSNIHLNNRYSKVVNANSSFRKLDLYSGFLLHNSVSDEYSDIITPAGIQKINKVASIYFPGDVVQKENAFVDIQFDIEHISSLFNVSNEIDDQYILDSGLYPEAKVKSELYEEFQNNFEFNIDNFALFAYIAEEHVEIPLINSVISSDLKTLTIRFQNSYDYIGLGFDIFGNKIIPSCYININEH